MESVPANYAVWSRRTGRHQPDSFSFNLAYFAADPSGQRWYGNGCGHDCWLLHSQRAPHTDSISDSIVGDWLLQNSVYALICCTINIICNM